MNKEKELLQAIISLQDEYQLARNDHYKFKERKKPDINEFMKIQLQLIEQYADEVSREEKPELKNNTYYLVLTIENKWGIALWKDKWWDSPEQDNSLAFGIKDEWIKTWYNLPNQQKERQ